MKSVERESRYVRVVRRAYEVSQAVLPQYRYRNSPKTYTLSHLAACVILKFYLNLPYRDMEEWLLASDQVCRVGTENRTRSLYLGTTFRKQDKHWLDDMQHQLLEAEKLSESSNAGDSTSFSLSQASSYYRTRSGKHFSDWVKGAYAVGTQSQLIVGSSSRAGRLPDFVFLRRLKRQERHYALYDGRQRRWYFLGDKGFDAKEVTELDLACTLQIAQA